MPVYRGEVFLFTVFLFAQHGHVLTGVNSECTQKTGSISNSDLAAIICSAGRSSMKKRSTIIASGHGCISSKNKSVYPELIGLPYMAAICDMIDF